MYIRNPEQRQWIQDKLNVNDNQPNFSKHEKLHILKKLNEAVSFENFYIQNTLVKNVFSLEGGESLIPAHDAVIEKAASMGVKEFVMGGWLIGAV